MTFDIIIPTYNNLPELKACLDGLAVQICRDFKAIVCIDGSTDGTAQFLASCKYPFSMVVAEHADRGNHGRNATRNLALPHLGAEYLLLLDSDAVAIPDLLDAHLRYLTREEGVSVGRIEYTNTKENIWARYISTRGRYMLPPLSRIGYHLFNSGNAAFRTKYFKELDGQDGAMNHYGGGDTEFAIRLFDRYHPPFFNNTEAVASSAMNKELAGALDQMVEMGRHNLKYLYQKHHGHRTLYGMSLMKKYPFLFAIAGFGFVRNAVRSLVPHAPGWLQTVMVRYLVTAAVYQGFSSK
jgi:glycosyltransferase involved in cell wall biosynthesis